VLEPEPNARSALDREERTRDRRRIRMPDASLIALDEIRHALPPRPTLRPIGTGRGTANRRAFRRALRILPRPRPREKTRAPLPWVSLAAFASTAVIPTVTGISPFRKGHRSLACWHFGLGALAEVAFVQLLIPCFPPDRADESDLHGRRRPLHAARGRGPLGAVGGPPGCSSRASCWAPSSSATPRATPAAASGS